MRAMRHSRAMAIAALCVALIFGGTACPLGGYNPFIIPAFFVSQIDNPYFPLVPGTTFFYEADTPDGFETSQTIVTRHTKTILGVTCIVVHDKVFLDGSLIEDTFDFYAQDRHGNVWYFGEDSTTYDNGVPTGTEGSWEAGVDGAKPGIIMEAHPKVGDSYRQEYLAGVAEDRGDVLNLRKSVTVPYGAFTNCLKTKDYTPLEPNVVEYKYYAQGVGNVLVREGGARVELVNVTTE
jgi:hypothetical protein